MRYVVELRRVESVEIEVEAESPSVAVDKASELHHGFRPESVSEGEAEPKDVVGACEACGKWLLEDDAYALTTDYCYLCGGCSKVEDDLIATNDGGE